MLDTNQKGGRRQTLIFQKTHGLQPRSRGIRRENREHLDQTKQPRLSMLSLSSLGTTLGHDDRPRLCVDQDHLGNPKR